VVFTSFLLLVKLQLLEVLCAQKLVLVAFVLVVALFEFMVLMAVVI